MAGAVASGGVEVGWVRGVVAEMAGRLPVPWVVATEAVGR